jgi:hypothetical protein
MALQRQSPKIFFTTCASLVANENLSPQQRQSAATVAGRLLVYVVRFI